MVTANKIAKRKLKTSISMGKKCEAKIPKTRKMENLTMVKFMNFIPQDFKLNLKSTGENNFIF